MNRLLENPILTGSLDGGGFIMRNVASLEPVPSPFLDVDDPMFSDPRAVLDGSVTNDSISPTAQIDQSKLNLNGSMPASWLGNGPDQAAKGNLTETISNRGLFYGHAELDKNGVVPSGEMPHGPAAGSVNSVFLGMPTRTFNVAGPNPITSAGTWSVSWVPASARSFFGVDGPISPGGPVRPRFVTAPMDVSLIPDLDASKFSGTAFPVALMPPAKFGTVHNRGIIPDPTQHGTPTSYLARNMTWRNFPTGLPNQPSADSPQITVKFEPNDDGSYSVVVFSTLAGSVLFTRVNDAPFTEAVQDPNATNIVKELTVQYGDHVSAYVAKQGYNDSEIAEYDVTPPPGNQ